MSWSRLAGLVIRSMRTRWACWDVTCVTLTWGGASGTRSVFISWPISSRFFSTFFRSNLLSTVTGIWTRKPPDRLLFTTDLFNSVGFGTTTISLSEVRIFVCIRFLSTTLPEYAWHSIHYPTFQDWQVVV